MELTARARLARPVSVRRHCAACAAVYGPAFRRYSYCPPAAVARHVPRSVGATLSSTTDVEASPSKLLEAKAQRSVEASTVPQFDWYRQWYPVRVIEDLDPLVPHAAQLLGLDLVLWRDGAKVWRCFEDRCPHRLAALSEGRIDERSGDLYCNYHGWQFDGAGKCTRIPQLEAEQQQGPQVRSPRACAVSYPTREAEGLLWVWGRGGPGAQEEADAAEWKGIAGALDKEGDAVFRDSRRWYFRDIPTGFVAFRENAFNDPAHEMVMHHGTVMGSLSLDRAKAAPYNTALEEWTPRGFVVDLQQFRDGHVLPCGCYRQDPRGHRGVAYVTPAAMNRTLLFSSSLVEPSSKPSAPNPLAALLDRRWRAHLAAHALVDADIVILNTANRNRAKAGGSPKLYLPAEADRGPAAFLAWMSKYGGGGPPVSTLQRPVDLSRPELPRRAMLDRYEQHTKHCRSCAGAHAAASSLASATRLLALVLAAAAAACLAMHAVRAGGGPGTSAAIVLASAAVGAAAAHADLARLVRRLEFFDYDHENVSKRP